MAAPLFCLTKVTMGRPRKISDEQLDQMRAMREAGATYKAIGAEFGVSDVTASYYLNPGRRERLNEQQAKRRAELGAELTRRNREYQATYRQTERYRARQRRVLAERSGDEKFREYHRQWHRNYRRSAKYKAYNAEYYQRDEVKLRSRIKSAKRRKKIDDSVTAAEIAALLAKPCVICCAPSAEIDHIMSLATGGRHSAENLIGLCLTCNRSKGWSGVLASDPQTGAAFIASRLQRP